jgi:hypothetical protein
VKFPPLKKKPKTPEMKNKILRLIEEGIANTLPELIENLNEGKVKIKKVLNEMVTLGEIGCVFKGGEEYYEIG